MNPGAHALDRRLRELREAQQALVSETRDLEADTTYALLTGDRLTGVTAVRARPALAQVEQTRQGLSLLDDLLSRIKAQQNEADVDAARLMVQLNGPSIVLGAEPGVSADGHAPPSGSRSSSGRSLTPDAVLATLAVGLAPAHQVVAEVDAAWRELLPRLDRVTTEAHHLAAELPGHRPVAAAVAAIEALPNHIIEDPLGAAEEVSGLESTLAGIAGARAELARLSEEAAGAARTLAELEGLLAEGRDAFDQTRLEIASPEGLLEPVAAKVLHDQPGLRPWLARLEQLVSEGHVSRAEAGLARWRALADQTLAVARQVAEANARPWRRRRELQGLLRAARVKAGALGRAEDPLVTELAGRALRSLEVPCDLEAAETAVEELLDGLRQPPSSDTTGGASGSVGEPVEPPAGVTTMGATDDADAGAPHGRTPGATTDPSGLVQPDLDHEHRPSRASASGADRRVAT